MMLKCLKPALLSAALAMTPALVPGPALAQDATAETVVATVNGTDITLGHVIMVRAGLPEQYLNLPDNILWNGIIDQLVQQTVLAQQGENARSRRVTLALENEERSLRAQEVVEGIVEAASSEEALRAAYDAQYSEGGGQEYNAAHILVETQEEAAAIAEEARGGADFATLAREHSTGPSGPNGGDLGWFGEGMMVAPFEAAVKAMEAGSVSDPVQTQFGWHVIKLNDIREQNAPAFDDVRAEIEQQVQGLAVETRLQELVDAAQVTRAPVDTFDITLMKQLELVTE